MAKFGPKVAKNLAKSGQKNFFGQFFYQNFFVIKMMFLSKKNVLTPEMAKNGPQMTKKKPESGQNWPKIGQFAPKMAKIGQNCFRGV